MANTYLKIFIQYVFAVQNRRSLINPSWRDDLYKYISGTVRNKGCKLYAIGGMPDHLHIFISMSADISPSSLMSDVKRSSSLWINRNNLVKGGFNWQHGYGAFSYSESHIDRIVKYINNQEEHHKKRSFIEEYKALLKEFQAEFDERYIFKEPQ